jgi:hypothetical protein
VVLEILPVLELEMLLEEGPEVAEQHVLHQLTHTLQHVLAHEHTSSRLAQTQWSKREKSAARTSTACDPRDPACAGAEVLLEEGPGL